MAMIKARTEFASALNQVCAERGIDPKVVLESIKPAILAAYRKDYGFEEGAIYEAEIDPETGGAKIYYFPEEEEEKKKEVTPPGFGRIAAQTAKQVILQKIREAEKNAIIDEYRQRVGTLVNGMVLRFEGRNIICDIGRGQGLMPLEEQVVLDKYRLNQRLALYILGIREIDKGERIIVSRRAPELVEELFRREVPEVSSGAVEIKKIAREAGFRTKIAVASTQDGVDPVGSCVGRKGVRVQAVINELGGEKIDVIPYSDEIERLVKAALSPAENLLVEINADKKLAEVKADEDQLSLAIGKNGQNARLASRLTGYKINIQGKGEKKLRKTKKEEAGRKESELEELKIATRAKNALMKAGIKTKKALLKLNEKELAEIKGLGKKSVEEIRRAIGGN